MQFGNRNIINARDISYDDAVIKLSEGQSNAKLQPLLEAIVSVLFELQNRVKTLEDKVSSIEKNIERLRADIGSLDARIAGQENTINIINNEIDDLQSRVTVLEGGTSGGAN